VKKHSKPFSNIARKHHSHADQVLEWFQLGKIQIPDHGHITRESILAVSFTRGKLCVWEGEMEKIYRPKIVIARNARRQISYVFGYSLSVSAMTIEGHTAFRVILES